MTPRTALLHGLHGLILMSVAGGVALAAEPPPPPVTGAHAQLACAACHVDGADLAVVRCTSAQCHPDQATAFAVSMHDRAHLAGRAPQCPACHGGHQVVTGKAAAAQACGREVQAACLACHPADRYALARGELPAPGESRDSVHAQAPTELGCTAAGLSCFSCHGAHGVLPASDPDSPVNRHNVAATCASCHPREGEEYRASIHAAGVAAGDSAAPTCVSCHGGHGVRLAAQEDARTGSGRVVFTCADCHEDPAVLREADLPYDAVQSYERSFHGVAYLHGMHDVATCASCHGAHLVLPPTDPRSTVNPANITATCGRCHENVTDAMLASVRHPAGRPGVRGILERLKLYFPVANTSVNPLLVSGMGALVGFLSGIFGVGGGFLMTPLLIFIGIPAAVAAATDAAQITAGASSGAVSHARLGNVDLKMGLTIVIGGWLGGFVGVQIVKVLRNLGNFDFFLKLVYVLILGFIGISMFIEGVRTLRGRSKSPEARPSQLRSFFNRLPLQMDFPKSGLRTSALLPVGAGFLVGVLAAFLGVGGGFIMLPTMIYIIGIPTRVAVGTDLFQIVLTCANVTLQQAITNHTVDVLLAVTLFAGSTIGAQFGVMASRRLKGEQVRVLLAVIVLGVMVLLVYQLVVPPEHLVAFAKSGGGH